MVLRFIAWHQSHPRTARWILGGPIAFLVALLFMASMPLILPAGRGGVNHLVMPVVLFPLIWVVALLYPVMAARIGRAAVVMDAVLVSEIAMILSKFLL